MQSLLGHGSYLPCGSLLTALFVVVKSAGNEGHETHDLVEVFDPECWGWLEQ